MKRLILLIGLILTLSFGLTAFAAPKTMPDGQTFDPQFYAATYPAVNELAKGDEALLYAHYANIGKLLNYLPYDTKQATTSASIVKTQTKSTPKTMPDGQLFDPKFYATTYPAVNELAKGDENLLYAHYVNIGKLLNYLPYDMAANQLAAVLPQVAQPQQNVTAAPAASGSVATPGMTVYLPKSGNKYHSIPNCGNMDASAAKPVTIEEAKIKNIPQCTKCF